MRATACPACEGAEFAPVRSMTAAQAADHLIPPRRSPSRNSELNGALERLWAGDVVEIQRCQSCGFGFADPFVAGDAVIYNLIGGGHQYYPGDRYEFGETIATLTKRGQRLRLLELGAGAGSFLAKATDAGIVSSAAAIEYDDSAIARLKALPNSTVFKGNVQEFAATTSGVFDAICMFQVLEHMDDLDSAFKALDQLTASDGEVIIAVPNHDRIEVQERLTGFMDMPPVHIGRWTGDGLNALARRHGLLLKETRQQVLPAWKELWQISKYRLESRTRRTDNVASRVEGIGFRPARGALKRVMAGWDAAAMSPHYGKIPPKVNWFRLGRPD